jgi:hypothetical protein
MGEKGQERRPPYLAMPHCKGGVGMESVFTENLCSAHTWRCYIKGRKEMNVWGSQSSMTLHIFNSIHFILQTSHQKDESGNRLAQIVWDSHIFPIIG